MSASPGKSNKLEVPCFAWVPKKPVIHAHVYFWALVEKFLPAKLISASLTFSVCVLHGILYVEETFQASIILFYGKRLTK